MKIIVGMSGGVDSTIAAYLLKKEGHEVIGANLNFVNNSLEHVGANTASPELLDIAEKLGIKIITRDYHEEFYNKIITSFVRDYENGITPNPCALCNGTMKFAKLLELMKEEWADMIATGHYANVIRRGEPATSYCIKKSSNQQKDQSYMLYRLTQEQLSHIIFPLGNMDKSDVRKLAAELNLSVATKKDSQDVCFIGTNENNALDYKEFIKQYELGHDYKEKIATGELSIERIQEFSFLKPGEFVDTKGNVLGFHNGIINYTIGQRRGINIAFGERKFVVKIDAKENQVVLGDNDDLMSDTFKIYDIVFSGLALDRYKNDEESQANDIKPIKTQSIAKLRYRHDGSICEVDFSTFDFRKQKDEGARTENFAVCKLFTPTRAITPGQAAVFYDDNGQILFGGRILV